MDTTRFMHSTSDQIKLCSRPARVRSGQDRPGILVRAWGLEPQRIAAREPKGYVTLVKDFQSPPYHEGRTSFQRFKRYSVMTGRIPAKS